ncbi:hypothetical protein GYH30_007544 [Glycine max]|nr:hypothetical protein GYH30_007544 [Glycine max]
MIFICTSPAFLFEIRQEISVINLYCFIAMLQNFVWGTNCQVSLISFYFLNWQES